MTATPATKTGKTANAAYCGTVVILVPRKAHRSSTKSSHLLFPFLPPESASTASLKDSVKPQSVVHVRDNQGSETETAVCVPVCDRREDAAGPLERGIPLPAKHNQRSTLRNVLQETSRSFILSTALAAAAHLLLFAALLLFCLGFCIRSLHLPERVAEEDKDDQDDGQHCEGC